MECPDLNKLEDDLQAFHTWLNCTKVVDFIRMKTEQQEQIKWLRFLASQIEGRIDYLTE